MAQQDTGLGWSAKEEYLISAGPIQFGSLSEYSATGYPNQPLPYCPTENDVKVSGLFIGDSGTQSQAAGRAIWAGVATENVVVFVATHQTTIKGFAFYSNEESFVLSYATKRYNEWYRYATVDLTGTFDPNTGLYVSYWSFVSTGLTSWSSDVIPEADVTTVIRAINLPFYKLNSGFAVVAFIKWRDFAPATYWTPMLVSTEENSVVISTDGTTEDYRLAKYSFRYDGMTFYVGYVRGVDGTPTTSVPIFDANEEFIGPGADSISLKNVFDLLASPEHANILVNETVDPYEPFGNTGEDGGEVDPDPEDDDIGEPTLPGLSFAATGLCRIYRADLIALRQLANYMWTDDTFLQTLINHAIQLIENPMDAIISLCLVPVAPPAFSVGTAEAVSVMYIPTPAAMWPVINQFARVDCGTLDLKETYGSALDYNPYTKVSCFLPYIGFVDLDTDEVMGKTLNVVYRIDVVTGVCVAMIKVDGEVMYQFSGHCAIQMPLSSADFSTVISSLLQAGKLVAGAALTAAGAPEVGGMLLDAPQVSQPSTTVRKMVGTERNPNTGRQITTGTVTETIEKTGKPLALGELAKRQSANTVGAIMNSKFGIEHSGGFSGNSGYLGVRRPFIIVKRPRLANPEQYGQYNGRPSMIYLNLGTCTGYTEVQSIQLTGIAATNSELSEIATLLKTGVIL